MNYALIHGEREMSVKMQTKGIVDKVLLCIRILYIFSTDWPRLYWAAPNTWREEN